MTDYNLLVKSGKAASMSDALTRGMSPERWAERSAAYLDREQREQALRTVKATEPTAQDRQNMAEAQSVEIRNALEGLKQLQYENNRQTSYRAFEAFDNDGDYRHINNMLSDFRKSGSKMYAQVARVDPITSMDIPALKQQGFSDAQIDAFIKDPTFSKSFAKITEVDGTVSYRSVDTIKGVSGYNDYASAKELKRQQDVLAQQALLAMGYPADDNGLEAFRRAKAEMPPNVTLNDPEMQEAITKHYKDIMKEKRADRSGSRQYRDTERQDFIKRQMYSEGYDESDPEWNAEYAKRYEAYQEQFGRTASTKKLEDAETAENELIDMGFLEMDISKLSETERMQIERRVRRIEVQGGQRLSEAEKSELMQIRKLTSLGNLAGELTDEQTGIIDRMLRTVKKYVTDDVEGIAAESAYLSFRNVILRAFAGAQQSEHENTRFIEAAGTLKQQRGPVLEQLRTQLETVKDAYEAILALGNPIVMKWRTGKTGENLYEVITALDERIEMIDAVQKGEPKPIATIGQPRPSSDVLTPEVEESMRADLETMGGTE